MWSGENKEHNLQKGYYTPPPKWYSRPPLTSKMCMSEKKNTTNSFHVLHKVPSGNSPYVKAKHVQLIEKDPKRAVALFWNAINCGDRVDSALKDMAVVLKQLDRSNEAIEAIKSFRHLCTSDSQESLDNVLVELYKRSGRLDEQVEVLRHKIKRLEESHASSVGKKMKLSRSHGKKVLITAEQEYARLLGNLAWAHMQQNDYKNAEDYYRKALSIEVDRNKQCNLAICLIYMNRIIEAKFLLQVIRDSAPKGQMDESYAKSFERASKLMAEMEGEPDKSSWVKDDEKEYRCQNVGLFTYTPCKMPPPYESCERNRRRISDDQLDHLKDGQGSFARTTSSSQTGTYTPPVQARRIPSSPFTQPQRSSIEPFHDSPFTQLKRSSIMLDSGNWINKKEPIPKSPFTQPKQSFGSLLDDRNRKVSISYFPRRLQFGKFSSEFPDTTDLNTNCQQTERNMSGNSSPVTEVDEKENLHTTGIEGRDYSCGEHCEWAFPICNNKGQKSWADMVEEEEQEITHPFS